MNYNSGFVTIIGRPNVGKSTLMNNIIGEKIAIMSDKPQTTRNKIQSIYTNESFQIIFIDTPGIHKPKTKLGQFMTESALNTLNEVDIILLVIDDTTDFGPGDKYLINTIKDLKTTKILAINKIDLISPEKFKKIYEYYDNLKIFNDILGVSAVNSKNIDDLIKKIGKLLPSGPKYFPDDMITDQPERNIISEIIREKSLRFLNDEVPHGIAVEIDKINKRKDEIIDVYATIFCEKKSHKGIIIGKNGSKLKNIGKSARIDIEKLLGSKVYLELWVKVKEDWREKDTFLKNFGYKKE